MNLFSNCFVLVSFAADLSKDGKWCYLVFWVVGKPTTRWSLLKNRLLEVCPSYFSTSRIYSYRLENQQQPKPPDVFLLKFWCFQDRKGLLHGTPFFLPLISLLVFLRKCFQVYLSLLPLLDFSYFCIHVIEVVFMEQIRYIFQLFWFFAFSHLVDVTEVLCELELTIKRVKVSTTPDGRVMDLFFITDTRFDILETFSFSARRSASLFVLFSFFF